MGDGLSFSRVSRRPSNGGIAVALESEVAGVFGLPDGRALFAADAGLTADLVGGLPPAPLLPPLPLRSKDGGVDCCLAVDRPPVVSPSRRVLISGGMGI